MNQSLYEELSEVLHSAKAARTDGRTEQTDEEDSADGTRRDGTDGQGKNDNDKTSDGADDRAGRWTEEDDADDGLTHEGYADFVQLVAPGQTSLDEFGRTRNVQERARTLVAVAIGPNRSSTLQYVMETKQTLWHATLS